MKTERFVERRRRLMETLGDGLILVRGAGAEGVNASFEYLTGLAEPKAVLLLAPGGARFVVGRAQPGADYLHGRSFEQVLFLPAPNALAAAWGEDSLATTESVTPEDAGVDAVFGLAEMPGLLTQVLRRATRVWVVRDGLPALGGDEDADGAFAEGLRRRFFHLAIADATPAVHEMRRVKDAEEVAAIERSVAVVAEALERAVSILRPGMRESELEGEIAAVYRAHGGTHAFDPIIASGANALKMHYTQNAGPIASGDMLLIDTGVSIDGYKADITRTLPVDGTFTPRQRELYEVVLEAQQAVIDRCVAGAQIADLHASAHGAMEGHQLSRHFLHGIGHHLGLETHDVGDIYRPLAAGCVITVEPGIYVADESIGIRIEDDVLVTDAAPRVLSEAIPKTVAAIESRFARR